MLVAESCATLCDPTGCNLQVPLLMGFPGRNGGARIARHTAVCGGAGLVIAMLARQVAPLTPSSGLRTLHFHILGRVTSLWKQSTLDLHYGAT